jgi:hypothetical protein
MNGGTVKVLRFLEGRVYGAIGSHLDPRIGSNTGSRDGSSHIHTQLAKGFP